MLYDVFFFFFFCVVGHILSEAVPSDAGTFLLLSDLRRRGGGWVMEPHLFFKTWFSGALRSCGMKALIDLLQAAPWLSGQHFASRPWTVLSPLVCVGFIRVLQFPHTLHKPTICVRHFKNHCYQLLLTWGKKGSTGLSAFADMLEYKKTSGTNRRLNWWQTWLEIK